MNRLDGLRAVYGGFAAIIPLFTQATLFESIEHDGITRTYRSEWEMFTNGHGGGLIVLGLLLVFALAGLCLTAALRPAGPVLLSVIVVLAALGTLLLATKSGTSDPKPPFTDAGRAELLGVLWLLAIATGHLIALRMGRTRATTPSTTPQPVE